MNTDYNHHLRAELTSLNDSFTHSYKKSNSDEEKVSILALFTLELDTLEKKRPLESPDTEFESLLQKAKTEIVQSKQKTPFGLLMQTAFSDDDVDLVKNIDVLGYDFNVKPVSSWCHPIHESIISGAEKIAIWLIEKGVNVNQRETECGVQPIHFAAHNHQFKVMEALIENGANPNSRANTKNCDRPLHYAFSKFSVFGRNAEVKKKVARFALFLFSLGANPSIRNRNETLPLSFLNDVGEEDKDPSIWIKSAYSISQGTEDESHYMNTSDFLWQNYIFKNLTGTNLFIASSVCRLWRRLIITELCNRFLNQKIWECSKD
jgi:ankyrin repeat protein